MERRDGDGQPRGDPPHLRVGPTDRRVTSADHPAEQINRVLTGDLANRVVVMAPCNQPTHDVLAVGWRFEAAQIWSRELPAGRVATERRLVKPDVIADQ